MDFPYIESHVNFIMDYCLVYAGVLVYLMSLNAGAVSGLDGLVGCTYSIGTRRWTRWRGNDAVSLAVGPAQAAPPDPLAGVRDDQLWSRHRRARPTPPPGSLPR
jgi:hypothetical protein